MKHYLTCPNCGSDDIFKNGTNHRGNQNYICRDCGRQNVENPQRKTIDDHTRVLVERLLLERISLAGIARAVQVSDDWLQRFVNRFYQQVSRTVKILSKAQQALTVELDELWSFVNSKGTQLWVWLALDKNTREIIGCHIGDRSRESTEALWASLQAVYRQCAVLFTDHWEAYQTVLPATRHLLVGSQVILSGSVIR